MIQHKTIDGLLLRDMVVAGAALLEKNREAVDALNVFPVPDGDTGTNMSLTMQSATREVNAQEYLRADEAAAAISKGALKGARGNSGVITSQLLRGFANQDRDSIESKTARHSIIHTEEVRTQAGRQLPTACNEQCEIQSIPQGDRLNLWNRETRHLAPCPAHIRHYRYLCQWCLH